ncbi:uncharacterized protein SCODWIG_01661 [Saccharomycodes ludwigii]|uniref:GP-PDE domain-containing protein n=1 Tax=Saccharomycodes ludwigii TaxID=36035 RepID=A0A376B732_9ASCO|nr:hypothetical protein SCDLUD_001104 [Saccharomycodes ludwigii]KAH3903464.1 hypothetical protein SCDLUD_001104 [Saccharomycodes ludwigii]SSD59900.1 uncharacterized protein SCODWIG_01661 [Saccharomycodes ludwigii]
MTNSTTITPPLIMGHRGFKENETPENSLLAFKKAYQTGSVDIIETDVQLTSDGEVIICHDGTTGRMYSKDLIISQTSLEDITSDTVHIREHPTLKILTLKQLLQWMISLDDSNSSKLKLLLDIKFTLDKIVLIKIYRTMMDLKPNREYWTSRIMFGIWNLDWFEFGYKSNIFNQFDVVNITLNMSTPIQIINYVQQERNNNPHSSCKLFGVSIHFASTWTDVFQKQLLPLLLANNIKLILWTVNELKYIDYYVPKSVIYAICTDKPLTFHNILLKKEAINLTEIKPWRYFDFKLNFIYWIYWFLTNYIFTDFGTKTLISFRGNNVSILSLFIAFCKAVHFL